MAKAKPSGLPDLFRHNWNEGLVCGCGVDWAMNRHAPRSCKKNPYRIRIELDGLPSLNTAANRHWRVLQREKKEWQARVAAALVGKIPPRPLTSAVVRLTRFSSVEPDADNLLHSFKRVLDQVVRSGVLEDDSPAVIGSPIYGWEKVPPKKGYIVVEVTGTFGPATPA